MGKLLQHHNERLAEDAEMSAMLAAQMTELEDRASRLERELKADLKALGSRGVKIERKARSISLHRADQCMTIEPLSSDEYRVGYPRIESNGFFQLKKANQFKCDEREMLNSVLRWIEAARV